MRQLLAVEFAFVAYFQVSRGDVGHASTGVSSSTAKVVRECSMRGVCGHRGAMHQTCPYHGPPLRISVEKHRQTLASLCPHLFQADVLRIIRSMQMDANNIHLSSGFDLFGKQESGLRRSQKAKSVITDQAASYQM
ncbi:hypothetical protein WUBG_09297 [Wuchereria bancrofti]|uniref:Uncharacterized protein n=1 Tax=Wuchereria bancrofti TaxID=6293 RepID=J9EBK0_WUCBA|nr:hypothetical protein WUBG_09297 [Wuchereria bancrofti]